MSQEQLEPRRQLQNIQKTIKKKTIEGNKSAHTKFDKFLKYVEDNEDRKFGIQSIKDLTNELCSEDILGKFSDWMFHVDKVKKLGTAESYLGKVKTYMDTEFPRSAVALNVRWYTSLRTHLKDLYLQQSSETGEALRSHAKPMKSEDLKYICSRLFLKDTRHDIHDRLLIILQFHCLGRISEVCLMQWVDILLVDSQWLRVLQLLLNRLKTGDQQVDMQVFLHANSWKVCPFHALGSHAILFDSMGEMVFSNVSRGNEVGYMNNVFRKVYNEYDVEDDSNVIELTQNMTSHSARPGGVMLANQHPDVKTSYLVPRGGWNLEKMLTIFNYLGADGKTDAVVGRALSEWKSGVDGGYAPGIEAIPLTEHDIFKRYVFNLIRTPNMDSRMKVVVVCVILLYHSEVESECPDHSLVTKVVAQCHGICEVEKMKEWAGLIKNWFIQKNSNIMPMQQLLHDPTLLIPAGNAVDFTAKALASLRDMNISMLAIHNKLKDIDTKQSLLESKLDEFMHFVHQRMAPTGNLVAGCWDYD